jgi:hypothetical protein
MRVVLLACTFVLGLVLATGCGNKTTKTSSTPSTIGGATTTVAPSGGVSYHYSRAESDAFVSACVRSKRGSRSACECAVSQLRSDTPESQLRQITAALGKGGAGDGSTDEKLRAVKRSCKLAS